MESAVVKKEMDAGIIQTLSDNNVVFLPYVKEAKLRDMLRPDIQALQTPEWNDANYQSVLPRVVSEIWRSFLERTVASATTNERLKRTQIELELERTRNQNENFFSPAESAEFDFLWESFNSNISLRVIQMKRVAPGQSSPENSYPVYLNVSTLIACLTQYGRHELDWNLISARVLHEAQACLGLPEPQGSLDLEQTYYKLDGLPNLTEQLLMYGLLESISYTVNNTSPVGLHGSTSLRFQNKYSQKYFRYRYWLAYNNKLPNQVQFTAVTDET